LKVFPFTSDRKAMSMIVKKPNGKIFVYTKGADSSMLAYSDKKNTDSIIQEVEEYAAKGLRTLVFGYKELNNQKDLATITTSEVEVGLHLVGVTAVEDLL